MISLSVQIRESDFYLIQMKYFIRLDDFSRGAPGILSYGE